jgi:hypothetical protein
MIKSLVQSGKYLTVSGSAAYPYINSYGNGLGTGNMRFNTQTQNVEVYNGNQWITCSDGSVSVGLNSDAESLLDWARIKRDEESRIVALAAKHPTVADALDAVKKAQEQLQVVSILCETNER